MRDGPSLGPQLDFPQKEGAAGKKHCAGRTQLEADGYIFATAGESKK